MAGPTVAFQTGDHASRPSADSGCVLYTCTTHGLVYRSDGTSWTTWLTLPSAGATDAASISFDATGLSNTSATDVQAALEDYDAAITAAGGGGGLAQSFLGYNTIGGTWTGITALRHYCKKFTLSATSIVLSVDVYLRPSTDSVGAIVGVISMDNSNAPGVLVSGMSTVPNAASGGTYLSNSSSMPGAGRWVSIPIGATLAAGDYWAHFAGGVANWDIANDASGSDQIFTPAGGNFLVTGAYPSAWALSNSTIKYSIRVNVLS